MPPEKRIRPGGNGTDSESTWTADTNDSTSAVRQIPPIGPHPEIDVLLIGALLWSRSEDAAGVLALVLDDDIENLASAAVLAAVRNLVDAGKPCGPQLVLDELRRSGAVGRDVACRLMVATTSGADAGASRCYAAAVVAESLRRRVESAGHALISSAGDGAEVDLAPLANRAAASVADCARRLEVLRGER